MKRTALISMIISVLIAALSGCDFRSPYGYSGNRYYSAPVYSAPEMVRSQEYETAELPEAHSVMGLEPIDTEDYYGRSQLSGVMLQIYDAIASGVESHNDSIKLPQNVTKDMLDLVIQYYMSDYPQHFWTGTSYSMYSDSEGYLTSVSFDYAYGTSVLENMKMQLNEAIDSFLDGITDEMSDYEKELLIYDRLRDRCSYDSTLSSGNIYNAYGALVENTAVCEGYAKALQLLFDSAGINTLLVHGETMGESHAWNIAMIENSWYQLDITLDDPIASGYEETARKLYSYFNVTTVSMEKDHTIGTDNYQLPLCHDTSCNYYAKEGLQFSGVSDGFFDRLVNILADAGKEKKYNITIRFTEDFENNYSQLTESGLLFNALEEVYRTYGVKIDTRTVGISKNAEQQTISINIKYTD